MGMLPRKRDVKRHADFRLTDISATKAGDLRSVLNSELIVIPIDFIRNKTHPLSYDDPDLHFRL
jgi:hypothetical protein